MPWSAPTSSSGRSTICLSQPNASAASSCRSVSKASSATSSAAGALSGSASTNLRADASASSGRPTIRYMSTSEIVAVETLSVRPATCSSIATPSSRLPAWNAVCPSAVSAPSSSGSISSRRRKASSASCVLPSAASASARSRHESAESGWRSATARSWSTASGAPVSTPARPASRSSSTSSGAFASPFAAASRARANSPASKWDRACCNSLKSRSSSAIGAGRVNSARRAPRPGSR